MKRRLWLLSLPAAFLGMDAGAQQRAGRDRSAIKSPERVSPQVLPSTTGARTACLATEAYNQRTQACEPVTSLLVNPVTLQPGEIGDFVV